MRTKSATYAVVVGLVGLGAFAVVAFGSDVASAIGAAPVSALVGLSVVLGGAAVAFTYPQLLAILGHKRVRQQRATLNPVVIQGIGSADIALNEKVAVDPAVRAAYEANLIRARFPPAGFTGKPKVSNNGSISVETPLTAGQDIGSAIEFSKIEDPIIRASHDIVRSLIQSEFASTVPALVETYAGVGYDGGSTALRTIAAQGDALSFEDAHLSILHFFHAPQTRRLRSPGVSVTVQGDSTEKEADHTPRPKKTHFFPVPRPPRSPVSPPNKPEAAVAKRPRAFDAPKTRSDLLFRGLCNYAHGWLSLARVQSVGDVTRVDRALRQSNHVAEVAAMWGLSQGVGLEVKRLTRDAGCGIIGSFTDVYNVASRGALTGTVQTLRLHGVRTMEGYQFTPGDCDESGRGRRVALFAYGAPSLVKEIPEIVRNALNIRPEEFFPTAAGVPGMTGAKFTLFVEASAEELDDAFPGLRDQPEWETYVQTVEEWNVVKSDDLDQMTKEAM